MAADEIEKICPICGRHFGVLWPDKWVYKRKMEKGGTVFLHSYGCMREYDKEEERKNEEMNKNGMSNTDLIVEVIQGNGAQALIDAGYGNYWIRWRQLRIWAQEHDPELYARMPEKLKKPVKVEEKKPVIHHKKKIAPENPEAAMDINNLELQGGVNYQLKVDEAKKPESIFTITAVDTELGSFSLVEGTDVIMWDAEPQDYVKMTRKGWEKLAEIIPKLLRTLGSCG